MFLIRVLWTSRLKHRDKSMADVSRQRERGCVARGGREGARGEAGAGGRYTLVSTVSSATGRLFLSTGLIYRPVLRYYGFMPPSLHHLVTASSYSLRCSPHPPPLSPLADFLFYRFRLRLGSYSRRPYLCLFRQNERPLGYTCFTKRIGNFINKIHLLS